MRVIKPSYFDSFRCIAGACTDSCCKEWDVLVDPEKAVFYRSLSGDLGDRLRQVLKEEDDAVYMTIENGRCPMWRTDGLCRIQAELGEKALCKTCQDFPRLTHDYGDFLEYGLELSCPEAARIILNTPAPVFVTENIPGGEEPEYDTADMKILLRTRDTARKILADTSRPVGESLELLRIFSCQAQAMLNGCEVPPFEYADFVPDHSRGNAKAEDLQNILNFFKTLEILTPQWRARLDDPAAAPWESQHRTLARYFVDRYWLQAISDFDLVGRVKFAIISCLVVKFLGGDLMETAQIYSKEIENSIENVDAILDAVYENPIFGDGILSGLLLL